MRRPYVLTLALLGIMLACAAAAAEGQPAAQHCDMIKLNHVTPQHMMLILGLCAEEDFLKGDELSWNRTDKPSSSDKETAKKSGKEAEASFIMPKGISTVNSAGSKKSLLVIGDTHSVEQFKSIVALLDKPVVQIQVATQAYEVSSGSMQVFRGGIQPEENKAGANKLNVAYINPNVLKRLKEQLENEGAQSVSSPVISTLNNMPAVVKISNLIPYAADGQDTGSGKKFIDVSTEIMVRPRANGDGTISVAFSAVVPRANKSDVENAQTKESPLTAEFRVKSGESVMLYETAEEGEDWRLFVVTPTEIKDKPGQQVGEGVVQ